MADAAPHPRFVGIGAGDHRKVSFSVRGRQILRSRGDVDSTPRLGWVSVSGLVSISDPFAVASALRALRHQFVPDHLPRAASV